MSDFRQPKHNLLAERERQLTDSLLMLGEYECRLSRKPNDAVLIAMASMYRGRVEVYTLAVQTLEGIGGEAVQEG